MALAAFAATWPGGEAGEPVWRLTWALATIGGRPLEVGLQLDPLAAVMLVVITVVGLCVQVYSVGYMHRDERRGWYFAVLSLFSAAMLALVLAGDFLLLYMTWEVMGLCSYLLIGFWHEQEGPRYASIKAFLTTRVGDVAFAIGLAVMWTTMGTFAFDTVLGVHAAWPVGAATAVAMLFLVGAMGKSAQVPLHVWLPDAMAGPTPVSALIHAATMVTAGVYMVARLNFIYALSASAMGWVALIGAVTAIFSASIGFFQYDIKKVLAYSTVSQLGFMFIGVGVGAYWAGTYHLLTHAFFKATLFLGSGSVILGCHHEQDMRKMGGLKKHMPITRFTYLAACWAIAGFPWMNGFYSKDEILFKAFTSHHLALFGTPTPWLGPAIWLVGIIAATGTSFYMFRSYYMTFTGEYRGGAGHHDEHNEDPHSAMAAAALGVPALSFLGIERSGSGCWRALRCVRPDPVLARGRDQTRRRGRALPSRDCAP